MPSPDTLLRLASDVSSKQQDSASSGGGGGDPLAACLGREAVTLAAALKSIQANLAAIAATTTTTTSSSSSLSPSDPAAASVLSSLCSGRVPSLWTAAAPSPSSSSEHAFVAASGSSYGSTLLPPSLAPSDAWLRWLVRRVQHVMELLTSHARHGQAGLSISDPSSGATQSGRLSAGGGTTKPRAPPQPLAVDLRCLAYPDAVLTAMRQAAGQRLGAEHSQLATHTVLLPPPSVPGAPLTPLPPPVPGAVGFILSGLSLQAAVAVQSAGAGDGQQQPSLALAMEAPAGAAVASGLERVVVFFSSPPSSGNGASGDGGDSSGGSGSRAAPAGTVTLPVYADEARRRQLFSLPLPVLPTAVHSSSSNYIVSAAAGFSASWALRGGALTLGHPATR